MTTQTTPSAALAEPLPLGQPFAGRVPSHMLAWTIRQDRFGEPRQALAQELVPVPEPGPGEVLVAVMAAGVNYNGVWAGRGQPVDVISARRRAGGDPEPFQICGTDASGVVAKLGPGVADLRVGDEVVLSGSQWDPACPHVLAGGDPVNSRSFRIWGYETNWGSFAQFCKVQARQCFPKPPALTWEEAGSYAATALAAYRMLYHWGDHALRPGDAVLVWGGAGGLGSFCLQMIRDAGALGVAVVSDPAKFDYCQGMGATGCVNRRDFDHWGVLPGPDDEASDEVWLRGRSKDGVLGFRRAFWKAAGRRVSPRLVIEHPGADTLPTSLFLCAPGGMVVTCGATSGYVGQVDLRYLWMQQKRLQGSHGADDHDMTAVNRMFCEQRLQPCLARTFTWDALPEAHELMACNAHPSGNMAVLVGAARTGLGARPTTAA
jgi:crotonyl-CoA carboxylase/reductase